MKIWPTPCRSKYKRALERDHKLSASLAEKIEYRITRRILVLGPRGSGKSTLVNTWQSIYSSISHQDREIQKSVILENIFESTKIIVDRISKEDEFLDDEHLHQQVEYVLMNHIEHGGKTLSAETLQSLRDIWGNSIFQAGLAKWLEEEPVIGSPSSLLHRPETAMFFSTYLLDHLDDILSEDYVLRDEEVMQLYAPTQGIRQVQGIHWERPYKIVEVGAWPVSHVKWFHHLSDMQYVFFVVPICDYDLTSLPGGSRISRFEEIRHEFHIICKSTWFFNKRIALFFNKRDLLQEKLISHPLEQYFPEYEGGSDPEKALAFVKDFFLHENPHKGIYTFNTDARGDHVHHQPVPPAGWIRGMFAALADYLFFVDTARPGGIL